MPNLASIVLAAGASSRFGAANKLLEAFEGRPLIARVVSLVREGIGPRIVVVAGEHEAAIAAAIADPYVRIVPNPDWQQGIGTSIATGVAALESDIDGAFIVPGDMPFLQPGMLRRLAATFTGDEARRIVYPVTPAGEQRNPVLWPRRFFSQLAALSGASGAKQLLAANMADAVPLTCTDELAFADVDTPGDLEAALEASGKIARNSTSLA